MNYEFSGAIFGLKNNNLCGPRRQIGLHWVGLMIVVCPSEGSLKKDSKSFFDQLTAYG